MRRIARWRAGHRLDCAEQCAGEFLGFDYVGGAHPSNAPGTHFAGQFGAFGAYGPWVLGYHSAGPSSIRDELGHWGRGISFTGHAAATAIVYGIGVSAFGAWRPHTSYVGAGFAVDVGKMY